jgi:polyisoprenyl-teichoic acid--peptidoglycan teichoic acid transferase
MHISQTLKAIPTKVASFSRKKKILLSLAVIAGLIAIAGLIFFIRIDHDVHKTFKGRVFSALTKHDPLKQDSNHVTSMLIFGNSSDDPHHGGALLADSIMVLSINNQTHKAYTVSVPRDLWVQYGMKCSNGTEGKINAVYQCALRNNGHHEGKASEAFKDKVASVLGIQIQYYAKVNYGFVRDSVNALGGVDVTINSSDPRGILDRTFDKNCPNGPYTCYNLKYPNGPVHLDGEHALYLSRARNAKGGYGLPQSNFDREINQQLVVDAIRKKALSTGVLANPLKVMNLANSFGTNISTNIHTSELQSAVDALRNIANKSITSIPLHGKTNPVVTTGMQGSQSIVLPTAGLYDYSQLQSTMQQALAQ